MKASCLNCRFSSPEGCRMDRTPDEDAFLCERYEMCESFRELMLKRIRGDFLTTITVVDDPSLTELPEIARP